MMKKYILYAIFLLVGSFFNSLNAVQLVFYDRTVFIAEFFQEDEKSITVKYKGNLYKIPKSDIESYDLNKTGVDNSYYLVEWKLSDGSRIRGEFVEENEQSVILKSELGFITINKDKISNDTSNFNKKPMMSDAYLYNQPNLPNTMIGIGLYSVAHTSAWNSNTDGSMGGNFFVEPAFMDWKSLRFGIKIDYSQTFPNQNTTIASGIIYGIYDFWEHDNSDLSVYLSVGLGGSSIQIITPPGSGGNRIGQSMVSDLSLGINYPFSRNYFIRTSIRNICLWENTNPQCGIGLEFSGGIKL